MKSYLRQSLGAIRVLLVLTVLLGVLYPLAITAAAQVPGLRSKANGSVLTRNGRPVGSSLIGQSFTDKQGNAVPAYFQSRPSAAGAGYDPTATGASNLGPESVEDVLPDPSVKNDTGKQSLLTQVCTRSLAVGKLEGVDGRRAYCSADGTGSVLRVFHAGPGYSGGVVRAVSVNQACPAAPFVASYRGVTVSCGRFGADYSRGELVALRGDAPSGPAVPPDAVTASGSGLDPQISPTYARLQEARVARARGISQAQVARVVAEYTDLRFLGFLGEDAVDVLQVNLALDREYPTR